MIYWVTVKKKNLMKKVLNAILECHVTGPHVLSHEVSAFIYIVHEVSAFIYIY